MDKLIHAERFQPISGDAILRLITLTGISEISKEQFMELWNEGNGLPRIDSHWDSGKYYGYSPEHCQNYLLNNGR